MKDPMITLMVIANVATIFTVFASVLKVASDFGKIKEKSNTNSRRLAKHDDRLIDLEKEVF